MSNVRLNSAKKIDNDTFKLKLGTTNKINPQVVYIEGRAFISPVEEKDDYSKDILDIKHKFKNDIARNIKTTNLFEDRVILDFQAAASGIALDKKSFISFQFLLRQKKDRILKLKDLKVSADPVINTIMNDLTQNISEHNFILSKTKK